MGIVAVYGLLFGIGKLIYGEYLFALVLIAVAAFLGVKLVRSKTVGGRL